MLNPVRSSVVTLKARWEPYSFESSYGEREKDVLFVGYVLYSAMGV